MKCSGWRPSGAIGNDWVVRHQNRLFQVTRQSRYAPARRPAVEMAEAGGWESGKPKAGFPLSHRHEFPFLAEVKPGPASPSARRRTLRAALTVKRVVVVDRKIVVVKEKK
jgi:hypothetical protein